MEMNKAIQIEINRTLGRRTMSQYKISSTLVINPAPDGTALDLKRAAFGGNCSWYKCSSRQL